MIKRHIQYSENSRATLFFRASATCSKILNDKKYIFNTVKIPGQLCFSRQAQLAQNSECRMYVSYSGNFQGKLCFSGQAQVAQKSCIIKNTYSI